MGSLLDLGYSWVDMPFMDGLEYFTAIFVYFFNQAKKLALLVGLIGIIWTGFQLMFSTMATRKAITDILLKFIMFTFIVAIYMPTVNFLKQTVTTWGMNAGNAKTNLSAALSKYMIDLESAVAKEDMENLSTWQVQLDNVSADNAEHDEILKYHGYDYTELRRKSADILTDRIRNYENKSSAAITFKSLQTILKPIDDKGNKSNSLVKAYVLDLSLKDSENSDTGFLSPNALLRVALLTAQVMYQKDMTFTVIDNAGKVQEIKEKKHVNIFSLTLDDVWRFLLLLLCSLGIILASVFAVIQYCMCVFEFTIISSIGIVFTPLMLFDGTKDFAQKLLPAMMSLAIKLLVITLCILFAFNQFLHLATVVIGNIDVIDWAVFVYVLFVILLSWIVTQNAPQIAVTLLTGNPQLSMNEVVHAAGTAAGMAAVGGRLASGASNAGSSAIRGGINAGQNIAGMGAEMHGAGRAAAAAYGGSQSQQAGSYMRAAGASLGRAAMQGIQNFGHNFMHDSTHGGSSRGGGDGNILNTNDANVMNKVSDQTLSGLESNNLVTQRNKSGYKVNVSSDESRPIYRAGTASEFMQYRAKMGAEQFHQNRQASVSQTNPPVSENPNHLQTEMFED